MKLTQVFALLVVLVFFGCKDDTVTVEVHDLGTYRGKVAQYGVDGNLAADQAGATISVEGTAFKGTTDASGNFQINNIPAGIYNLLITKPGYDTDLVSQNQFSGSGTQFLQNEVIQAIPFDSILILNVDIQRSLPLPPDSLGHRDTSYSYHFAVTCKNIGIDSLIPVSVSARALRSQYHFEIPGYTIATPSARLFERDSTVYSRHFQNRLQTGDSITITTQARSKGPSGVYGIESPYIVSRTFVLP